jgi:hypothetical protein
MERKRCGNRLRVQKSSGALSVGSSLVISFMRRMVIHKCIHDVSVISSLSGYRRWKSLDFPRRDVKEIRNLGSAGNAHPFKLQDSASFYASCETTLSTLPCMDCVTSQKMGGTGQKGTEMSISFGSWLVHWLLPVNKFTSLFSVRSYHVCLSVSLSYLSQNQLVKFPLHLV